MLKKLRNVLYLTYEKDNEVFTYMRMKKVFALLLTGMMTVSAPAAVFASSTEEQIADVQAQKDAAQAELAQEQANMASLESKKQELESYLEELNAQYTDLTNSIL